MKTPLSKLLKSQSGFGHWAVLAALVVVVGIGAVGYKVETASHADTVTASVCGSGYNAWGQFDGTYKKGDAKGEVLIYRNASANKMCVINLSKGDSNGVAKPMSVKIHVSKNDSTLNGGADVRDGGSDSGNYKFYAGPVYVSTDGFYKNNYCLTFNASTSYKGDTASSISCATL